MCRHLAGTEDDGRFILQRSSLPFSIPVSPSAGDISEAVVLPQSEWKVKYLQEVHFKINGIDPSAATETVI